MQYVTTGPPHQSWAVWVTWCLVPCKEHSDTAEPDEKSLMTHKSIANQCSASNRLDI